MWLGPTCQQRVLQHPNRHLLVEVRCLLHPRSLARLVPSYLERLAEPMELAEAWKRVEQNPKNQERLSHPKRLQVRKMACSRLVPKQLVAVPQALVLHPT